MGFWKISFLTEQPHYFLLLTSQSETEFFFRRAPEFCGAEVVRFIEIHPRSYCVSRTVILNQDALAPGVPGDIFTGASGCHAVIVLLGVQMFHKITPKISHRNPMSENSELAFLEVCFRVHKGCLETYEGCFESKKVG